MQSSLNLSYETFCELFNVLLSVYSKRDEDGTIAQLYYELLERTNPTADEMWEAVCHYTDNQLARFPSGRDLKQVIWNSRSQKNPALPVSALKPLVYDAEAAKLYRTIVLAQVYKGQGDTSFYRALLSGKVKGRGLGAIAATLIPLAQVTHEDVLDSLGGCHG